MNIYFKSHDFKNCKVLRSKKHENLTEYFPNYFLAPLYYLCNKALLVFILKSGMTTNN